MNFELLHIHHLLVFELTAVGNGDDGDGVSGFQGLSLCHDLRHDLTVVVTQIIPEMSKKKISKLYTAKGDKVMFIIPIKLMNIPITMPTTLRGELHKLYS